ncbi:UNVERIFIED_CONTAM: hypothetical protein Sindi_0105500 [Sesamum indicum]
MANSMRSWGRSRINHMKDKVVNSLSGDNMTQAIAFAHNLSLQCSMWRHDKIIFEAKTMEMEKKILEQQSLIESLQSDAQEKKELASKLEVSERELEEARSTAQTDLVTAFDAVSRAAHSLGPVTRTSATQPFYMADHSAFIDRRWTTN